MADYSHTAKLEMHVPLPFLNQFILVFNDCISVSYQCMYFPYTIAQHAHTQTYKQHMYTLTGNFIRYTCSIAW